MTGKRTRSANALLFGYDLVEHAESLDVDPALLQPLFTLCKQEGFIDARWYKEQRDYLEMWHPKAIDLVMKYRDFDAIPDSEFGTLAPNQSFDLVNAFTRHDRRFLIYDGWTSLMKKADIINTLTKSLTALRLPVSAIHCAEVPNTSYDLQLKIELSEQSYQTRFVPRANSWPPKVWMLIKKIMFEQTKLVALHMPGKSMIFMSDSLGLALVQAGLAVRREKV
ncbi:hypothetical protein [Arsukibacterium indicum]|uniref:Uncharacterized protein n=1 Tax=Arsukibacterium indicum TaxID=2848612 RepID=A0ABS6MLP9_9GAMM|nr:hypothetical protein [Arsukibacterium indicum]MBV2129742.1 hypothetical protein [Arsukibacterium indicum]